MIVKSNLANKRKRLLALLKGAFQLAKEMEIDLPDGTGVSAILAALLHDLTDPVQ